MSPNILNTSYTFTTSDLDPPVLQNQIPAPGETDVLPGNNIVLEIIDVGAGLKASSVVLEVNNVVAWQSDAAQPGFAVGTAPVSNGLKYTIDPVADLPELSTVRIDVYAEDWATVPNILDTFYEFQAGGVAQQLLIQTQARAPSLITFLAQDFAIQIDTQESEERQRSWVRNVSKWIGQKGTDKAYWILGAISGFEVLAEQLWRITPDMTGTIPALNVFEIGEAAFGRLGTDGSLITGTTRFVRLYAPSASFRKTDVGSQVRTRKALDALNRTRWTIETWIDSNNVELRNADYAGGAIPDYGIGGVADDPRVEWDVIRLYTNLPATLPYFDQFIPDFMSEIFGTAFTIDKFCWEDDFNSTATIQLTVITPLTETRYVVTATTAADPSILDAILPKAADGVPLQEMGTWEVIDSAGTKFFIESIPAEVGSASPPVYTFEVEVAVAPAVGAASLRYVCETQILCSYCPASKVRVFLTAGSIASETGIAIQKALERVLLRIEEEVVPAHVDIVAVFSQIFEVFITQGGHDGSLNPGSTEFSAPSARLTSGDTDRYMGIFEAAIAENIKQDYLISSVLDSSLAEVTSETGISAPDPGNPYLGWHIPLAVKVDANKEIFPDIFIPLTAYFDDIPADERPTDYPSPGAGTLVDTILHVLVDVPDPVPPAGLPSTYGTGTGGSGTYGP